jgi:ribosomal protein S18 acetylase RimI-like enzyme
MLSIEELTAESAAAELPNLIEILIDSVASGASVGFLPPLAPAEARDYWAGVVAGVEEGARVLLIARQDERAVGTVQLEFASKPNARHRAEVQKLLVHTTARRQGIGRALMAAVEDAARRAGRTLLVLDTRQGDPSEQLYRAQGYTFAGSIPAYARNGEGGLDATALYYRLLEPIGVA